MRSDDRISLTVNGRAVETRASPTTRLLDFLRDELGLTGAKEGCGGGECGACTVLLDGDPVCTCLTLLGSAAGREVLTVEGLAAPGAALHPIQQAFVDEGAVQCGFCTPGLVLSTKALLDRGEPLTEERIRLGLAGNLCRCTGYTKIVAAVRRAADAATPASGDDA